MEDEDQFDWTQPAAGKIEKTADKDRRLSLVERQVERAQSTPRRSTSASLGGAGNPVALLMRVRKAAKTMEKRARVRKSTVEQNQPELLGESEPSTTNDDYVYVDLSGITSAALAADKEPDLIDIDELVTQCLNIEKKKSNAVNLDAEALVNTFVATYRVFSSAENMVKTLYNHYNRGLEKTHRAQIIKAVFQLVMKILPDLTEQELSQCSTALDAWEKIVKQESDQWYNQLKQLVSKTLDKRTSNRAVDYEQHILKYKEEVTQMSDIKGKDLAEQMTLLDSWFYEKLDATELITAACTGSLTTKKCPALRLYWQHMERMKEWFTGFLDTICNLKDKAFEINLDKLFTIMKTLRKLNNYGAFFLYIAVVESAPLRGDNKTPERRKAVDKFWYLMSEYKDLLLNTSDTSSVYRKILSKLKTTSPANKSSFIPDLNLTFVAMRRFITVDGMMFYNSGINFQKNINIYKELKDFSDFKSSYASYKIEPIKAILKVICQEPPKTSYSVEYGITKQATD